MTDTPNEKLQAAHESKTHKAKHISSEPKHISSDKQSGLSLTSRAPSNEAQEPVTGERIAQNTDFRPIMELDPEFEKAYTEKWSKAWDAVWTAPSRSDTSSGKLIQCIAESRDALNAILPYVDGSGFNVIYAIKQAKEQIARCQAAIDAQEETPNSGDTSEHCNGEKLLAWINNPKRKPAHLAFTDGIERQIAYCFEPMGLSEILYKTFSKRNAGEILAYLEGVLEGKYPMPSALMEPKREAQEISGRDVLEHFVREAREYASVYKIPLMASITMAEKLLSQPARESSEATAVLKEFYNALAPHMDNPFLFAIGHLMERAKTIIEVQESGNG